MILILMAMAMAAPRRSHLHPQSASTHMQLSLCLVLCCFFLCLPLVHCLLLSACQPPSINCITNVSRGGAKLDEQWFERRATAPIHHGSVC